ncbi:MAG: short-chain dehydrogenase [Gammaproteobacteria bacterium SG8_30]|jgi:NAD(P)-dependent dehydrogenase (short-subunit alcohol dehydrogenase family)|nr:MAG: short-chain dehydrogenase [Gammaproteobacteria bacterium SG8_30]
MFSLQGKHAFITGGSQGIGLAVARRYRQAGAEVTLTDIADGTTVAAEIGARFLRLDVSDEGATAAALDATVSAGGTLDVVVLNAGIGDVGQPITQVDSVALERMTRINQWGVLYGLKHAPTRMKDGGSIIATSSLAAIVNMPGSVAYSAAKRAVLAMIEMAALELGARGIRANAVCPGYVATAMGSGEEGEALARTMTALGRVATTDDLVGVYHFLATDESSYVTGQAIRVDGGWTAGASPALLTRVIGAGHVS